jgi:hypothetical protein
MLHSPDRRSRHAVMAAVGVIVLTGVWFSACRLVADERAPGAGPPPQANPQLAMNLNGPADWNTELPFVDVFRLSRTWISQRKGESWGKGPDLELDEHGWVKRLEPDCWAESPLCTIDSGRYPGGRYTVLYDGRGRIDFWGAAKTVADEPGRMIIEVDPSRGGFFLRLHETDPNDHVRNIRVVMPGFETTYRDNPFHPVFLKRWAGDRLLPVHGLDAHQRLEDRDVGRPADPRERDLYRERRRVGVDDRLVQPAAS